MNTHIQKTSDTAHIYEREYELLEKNKKIQRDETLSKEDILAEYIKLGREYEKLLKQTLKITRIGDSNQKRLLLANEQIENQKEELKTAYEKLDLISRTDTLTQLSNRRDFLEEFGNEINRFERNGKPFTVILAHIDNFKAVNDQHGHDAGDFILARQANLMKSSVRKQDIVARWGGEEFIFLLPQTPIEGGKIVAEEIRKKIQDARFTFNETQFAVTITLGLCEFNGSCDMDGCIKKADLALYEGKRKGKNCIFLTPPTTTILTEKSHV